MKQKLLRSFFFKIIPLSWVYFFIVIPFIIIVLLSFSESAIASPPIKPIFEFINSTIIKINLSLVSFKSFFTNYLYLYSFFYSIFFALTCTILCLLCMLPVAYFIARFKEPWNTICFFLMILPFGSSFLIRVYCWVLLLNNQGIINSILLSLNFIDNPLNIIDNQFATAIGVIYSYLPFMFLPLYSRIKKIDKSLFDASFDLGMSELQTFFYIVIPLCYRAIIASVLFVFIPIMGEFIIPELLGGKNNYMIGKILWIEFFMNKNWGIVCVITVCFILFLTPILLYIYKTVLKKKNNVNN